MISLVVVTWNRLEYTKQCLESIAVHTDVPYELIVVDNGSTDGSAEWLREYMAHYRTHGNEAQFIGNEENLGCAVAFNQGFAAAKGDPIFRIDNDVILPSGWASTFMRHWDEHPEIGMMTTDLETDPRNHPELVGVFDCGVTFLRGPVWHSHGLGSWCMAHRRKMFEECGHYRTDFGLIVMNDTDLERRAQIAGWELATLSGLRVGHLWTMDASEDERRYNHWKLAEQAEKLKVWTAIWGDRP